MTTLLPHIARSPALQPAAQRALQVATQSQHVCIQCRHAARRWQSRTSSKVARARARGPPPTLEYQKQAPPPPARTTIVTGDTPSATPRAPLSSSRRVAFYLSGISLFVLSAYCSYLYVAYTSTSACETEGHVENADKPDTTDSSQANAPLPADFDPASRYDDLAPTFDSDLETTEWLMGLNKLRRRLAGAAVGHILEVSIGTGRNLPYYTWDLPVTAGKTAEAEDAQPVAPPSRAHSFTAIDVSPRMLEVAEAKFAERFPGVSGARWVLGDACQQIPPPPRTSPTTAAQDSPSQTTSATQQDPTSYDTIIQSMGLCSVRDPVALLEALGRAAKPDTGRILLLEHGRGTWPSLNALLDRTAPGRARRFGCLWNRDLRRVVAESGLEVVAWQRRHFGTTWCMELRRPVGWEGKRLRGDDRRARKDVDHDVEWEAAGKRKGWW